MASVWGVVYGGGASAGRGEGEASGGGLAGNSRQRTAELLRHGGLLVQAGSWEEASARNRPLAPPPPTASPGEVAPGGGPVTAAARAGLRRLCGARVPSLPSFAPAVLLPWIPVPGLPGPQNPQAGSLPRGSRQAMRCPGPCL